MSGFRCPNTYLNLNLKQTKTEISKMTKLHKTEISNPQYVKVLISLWIFAGEAQHLNKIKF